jgi:acyl carrier protein
MPDVRQQVQEVFRQVFDDPELVLRDAMTADDVLGWDSLTHINLMVAIEKQFHIKFGTAEISRLKGDDQNVGNFLELIATKLRHTQ